MVEDIQKLKNLLQREVTCEYDDDALLCEANEKLQGILQKATSNNSAAVEDIRQFAAVDESKKRKLLLYSLNFVDRTVCVNPVKPREQVCQHAFLKQDELYMLHQFVMRHKNDITFGDMVYKIMDKHGLTAPQVYKSVLLRKQDFSRVTDPRCKNVTRKMVWQIIIGLRCSLKEADEVLFSAGYIRRNNRMDLTMQYFIENNNFDIEAIDSALANLGLKTFTCE